ncbi:hypothetical protein RRG08_066298 [Elysia crispata]|uniref:Uncharacterized protein n=1 Tax=Elysia crispata TaxID=231223 RepID=A0AAE1APT6_9GAST|nr:hypothetical protein RRG08_066298 [Elysia crispata]
MTSDIKVGAAVQHKAHYYWCYPGCWTSQGNMTTSKLRRRAPPPCGKPEENPTSAGLWLLCGSGDCVGHYRASITPLFSSPPKKTKHRREEGRGRVICYCRGSMNDEDTQGDFLGYHNMLQRPLPAKTKRSRTVSTQHHRRRSTARDIQPANTV